MRYTLENEELQVEVDTHGAELKSMRDKASQLDYMWRGDPAYYGRTSPNLFPIVGGLREKKYRYDGTEYEMSQHGFIRDMDWKMEQISEKELHCVVEATEDTLRVYPFRFRVAIHYLLTGRSLKITWTIENCDTKKMYYSFGGHPCFTCPIHGEADKVGYGYDFHKDGNLTYYRNDGETGLFLPEAHELPLQKGRVTFTKDFFDTSTYILTDNETQQISLFDPQGQNYLTVSFDAPMVGLWSAEGKNAPYAAIEPWYGRCDDIDFSGSIEERAGEMSLEAGGSFSSTYTITAEEL